MEGVNFNFYISNNCCYLIVPKFVFMKQLYLLLFSAVTISASAQSTFRFGYSASVPLKEMADNMNLLHSMTTGFSQKIPSTCGRLYGGAELSWGMYANTTKEQTFTFNNGTSTKTDVNYSSNVFKVALNAKMFAFRNSLVNPYLTGKAGWASFYSNIYVEDPHDPGGCKALQQRNIIKDGTLIGGYGGGLQIDWSLFSKKQFKGTHFFDISINKVSGGKIDYINTKKLYDAANPPASSGSKALNVKFVNATTNEIHEHQVAEVFNTPLRMLEFKITAAFSLPDLTGRCRSRCHH